MVCLSGVQRGTVNVNISHFIVDLANGKSHF